MFVGRKKELNALLEKYNSSKKEFGIIYGRRRIGKSTLINEFVKDKECIFFQAKQDSMYGNIKSFSYLIDKTIGLPLSYVFPSMEEAFDSIIHYAQDRRFIIVIDEYPYIVKQNPSFPSILQSIVDKAPDNIFFIISGSDVSMLKKEIIDHNSPLYKRRTFEMNITKLSYKEGLEYLNELDNETKIKYLSICSTYPYYLSAFNYSISFEDNVKNLLFNQYGTFFSLPDQLLSNSTNIQDVYNSILFAISKRKRSIREIALFIKEEDAKVCKYLDTLLQSELVEKKETYMGNKKTTYYEIGDPMLRFWYSFIFENSERIKRNGDIVFNEQLENIKQFICFGFEDIGRLYMNELNCAGLLGSIFDDFKNYKVEKSKLGRSVEIDGVTSNDKRLLVMECKYRKIPFSKAMFDHLKESVSIFPDKLKREYYLLSKNGFDKEIEDIKDDNIHLVDLDTLFK